MKNTNVVNRIHVTGVTLMTWGLWLGMNSVCHVNIFYLLDNDSNLFEITLKVYVKWNTLMYKHDFEINVKDWKPNMQFNPFFFFFNVLFVPLVSQDLSQ